MHRRIRWLAFALLALAIGVALLRPPSPGRVRLQQDRVLRVLAVSYGTNHVFSAESWWRRAARSALPVRWQKPLGPFRGQRLQTKHDSLVLWIDEVHAPGTLPVELLSESLEAVMPDGSGARGRNRRAVGSSVTVEFSWFDRAARQVPLRVHDGTNPVTFLVDNPQPARAARWVARTPPQTCVVARTEMALLGVLPGRWMGRYEEPADAVVKARGLGAGRVGWLGWRVTAFDPWGNWEQGDWQYGGGMLRVPSLPGRPSTWKLSFEALEYLSAGLVPSPTNGSFVVLPPGTRAREFGARFVMFAGPGAYRVTNGNAASVEDDLPSASPRPAVWYSSTSSTASPEPFWVLELRTATPVIVCLSEDAPLAGPIEIRLRERMGGNGGRTFWTPGAASAKALVNGTNQMARVYAPRLPAMTTDLEVELIIPLPPAVFHVIPPGFQ